MVSPRKANSALNLIPEEQKLLPCPKKSNESLCSQGSSGSAQILYRAKRNTLGGRQRQPSIIPASSDVRQRVLSARRLRMKTYQNQLADAQQTISELAHENRILRTLHKRQDSALAKYESSNAELPQLLHSHAEELRIWQAKYRNLQSINKELEQKLKQKESLILSLTDQNKYYIQLNKDKNLEDRQRLTEKLQTLEGRLQEKDNEIKLMNRKLQLEGKKFKQQMQMEQNKSKAIMLKLDQARLELSGFRKLEDLHIQEKLNAQMKHRNKPTIGGGEQALKKNDCNIIEKSTPIDTETADDTEGAQSHRSQQSLITTSRRTATTIRKATPTNIQTPIAKLMNPSVSTPTALIVETTGKISNLTNQSKVPKAIIKRIDRGDGDAPTNMYKTTKLNQMKQTKHPLPIINQSHAENMKNDYEDTTSYNESSEAVAPLSGDDTTDDSINNFLNRKSNNANVGNDNDDEDDNNDDGINGDFMSNIDADYDDDDDEVDETNAEQENNIYDQADKLELAVSNSKTRMKEEISTIRKKISHDFKEREAFLETFCRQASTITHEDINSTAAAIKKRSNHLIKEPPVPVNRKHKLLAALKAIDNDKNHD